jgi:hypothetical protein
MKREERTHTLQVWGERMIEILCRYQTEKSASYPKIPIHIHNMQKFLFNF